MPSKNGNGQAVKTDPTAVATKKPEIPRKIRNIINDAFASWEGYPGSDSLAERKKVLAYVNGLLKNQKDA
jgi:hypothetical protein